jgi:DNA-binding transcriptional regulator YdaS (Cro superfamily)
VVKEKQMQNSIRVKVLPGDGKKFGSLVALEAAVNPWIKSRRKSNVVGVRTAGNATKGYEAVVTYHVLPTR